jgi:hypothetical protein
MVAPAAMTVVISISCVVIIRTDGVCTGCCFPRISGRALVATPIVAMPVARHQLVACERLGKHDG